jgi:hypothetical protein
MCGVDAPPGHAGNRPADRHPGRPSDQRHRHGTLPTATGQPRSIVTAKTWRNNEHRILPNHVKAAWR